MPPAAARLLASWPIPAYYKVLGLTLIPTYPPTPPTLDRAGLMPERDSQELSLIPCGSRPFSSALSCGSATPYPYPSNEIASTLFIHVPRSKTCTKIEVCITRQSAKWQTLASAPAATTLAMSRRYPGARPPLGDLLEEEKKAGTRAKDGQPKKEPSARKDGSLVPPPPTLVQLGLMRNEASECLKLAAQKRKSERPGPRRHQPS